MNYRRAAARATAMSLLLVLGIAGAQGAVSALAVGGEHPATAVRSVPTAVDAPAWADAPSRTVDLSRQQMALPFGGGSTDALTVTTAVNDSHVGFKLEWRDPTRDANIDAPTAYSDAAAVMLRTGDRPPITMGSVGTPVNVWYWRASWQFARNRTVGGDMYVYPHPKADARPGRTAGNPISLADGAATAHNYYAEGFGSLSHAPAQNVDATARRTDDGWAVVFVRERAPGGSFDAALNGSRNVYLAFAVWNGSAGEVNSRKSITLTFTTLDTAAGELSAAGSEGGGTGGSSGDTGGGGGAAQRADGTGDWLPDTPNGLAIAFVVGLLIIWSVAFLGEWRGSR